MKQVVTHLNAIDIALLLMLFEGATLFVMGALHTWAFSRSLEAALIGFIGTPIALALWHGFGGNVRGKLGARSFALTHISVVPASIANALFLIVLFLIEDMLPVRVHALNAVLGFVAVMLALCVLFFLYNHQPFKISVTLGNVTSIMAVAPWIAVLAGMYEAFILPIMVALMRLPLPVIASYPIAGLVSGFVGGLVGTMIFNALAPHLKSWIDL